MLIGSPLKHHPSNGTANKPRAVHVTAFGIRIIPAIEPGADASGIEARRASASLLLEIIESLSLVGLTAPGGDFLPPLELSGCAFSAPIDLSGAHLQSLKMEMSRFPRLVAIDASVNGSLVLRKCGPRNSPERRSERAFLERTLIAVEGRENRYRAILLPEPDRGQGCACPLCKVPARARANVEYRGTCGFCCELDLDSAEIAGTLEISRTYLRAAKVVGRKYATPRVKDHFAAFLDGIKVGGSIRFERCTTVGRVSLASAEVVEDIWVLGGKYVASAERRTFDLQLAKIGGLLVFTAHDASADERKLYGARAFPLTVVGQVSGIALSAGEIWIGEGFYFAHDTMMRGGHATINFGKANCARTFKIGTYHEHQEQARLCGGAWIHGEICLTAGNVGKNLEIHRADCARVAQRMGLGQRFYRSFGVRADEAPRLRFSGHGVKVDRRVYFSRGRFVDAACRSGTGTGSGAAAPIEGAETCAAGGGAGASARTTQRSGKPAAIDFWKSTIGTGFRIEQGCTCVGGIRLNSCVIGREAIVRCRSIALGPDDWPLAEGAREKIPVLLDISESSINGHLRIGRRNPRPPPGSTGESGEAVLVNGAVSLESANVQGSVLLGHLTIDLERCGTDLQSRAGATAPEAGKEDGLVALNLRDCTCGSDLEVHGLQWRLPDLTRAEKNELEGRRPRPRGRLIQRNWEQRLAARLTGSRFRSIDEGFHAIADLRGLRCGFLVDGFGAEWGLIYRLQLRLAGLRIGEVEPASQRAPHSISGRPERPRVRWLAFHQSIQEISAEVRTPASYHSKRVTSVERFFRTRHDHTRPADFVPQAHDSFSLAYRQAGEKLTADRILVEKKDILNALYFWRLLGRWYSAEWMYWTRLFIFAGALLAFLYNDQERIIFAEDGQRGIVRTVFLIITLVFLLWPLVAAGFQALFKWLFLYGLSAERGLLVFAAAIILGWGGVHYARNGGVNTVSDWGAMAPGGVLDRRIVMVAEVVDQPGDASAAATRRATLRGGDTRDETRALVAMPTPCNREVSSLLYALDLFIPLVDLDQERRCTVRAALEDDRIDAFFWWRLAKALYELIGWLVTSLLVLTVSGVLRRDLER